MELNKIKLIDLPKITDDRGNLSFFENNNQIPFEILRTYWIYDVPGGEVRGSHAFKESRENLTWRTLENFSTNSLALVVSSSEYDEKDYIRNFENFKFLINE